MLKYLLKLRLFLSYVEFNDQIVFDILGISNFFQDCSHFRLHYLRILLEKIAIVLKFADKDNARVWVGRGCALI